MRYYEDIGLVALTGRTDGLLPAQRRHAVGTAAVHRRAKQLGCSLDEIAELATVWDGSRCGAVQERLRATVDAKIAEAHTQIAELTTLAADLQRAAAGLSIEPVDGPAMTPAAAPPTRAPATTATSVPLIAKTDATATPTDSTRCPSRAR